MRDLEIVNDQGVVLVESVSFEVRAGEIYAIAGVQGNGQTEVTQALVGLVKPASGEIRIDGRSVNTLTTDEVLDLGVGYVPEDRLHDGLVGSFTVAENLVLDMYDKSPFASGGSLNLGEIERNARARIDEFDVRTPGTRAPAGDAVGGQPAEGRAGPRAVPAAEAAGRRAADPRSGRRVDGVRAPPHRGASATRARRWS